MAKTDRADGMAILCTGPVLEIAKDVWFIWQKDGHPPRFVHPTEERANREAQRLARRWPGTSFIVMHAVRKFRVEKPAEVDYRAHAEIGEVPWP